MPTREMLFLVSLLLAVFCQSSCAPKAISSAELLPHQEMNGGYLMGPGDKVRITLYGDDSFTGEYRVSPAGLVSLPLIGDMQARDMTITSFRNSVSDLLAEGFYNDPRVSAEIIEFRPFYILGEVQKPGEYGFVTDLTLDKAVAIAGGYTYRASLRTISIQRAGSNINQRVSVDQTIKIGPGDTIKILERSF